MRKRKKKYTKNKGDTTSKAKKVAKIKKKRVKQPKTRNAGTFTEQQFWNMIRQLLRRRTIFWLPIVNARNKQRIPYKGPNKRRKYSYICEECGGTFANTQVSVHHSSEAGSLTCKEDAGGFIERLFCEDGLRLLCQQCHLKQHEK